jgi:hypothetical protein
VWRQVSRWKRRRNGQSWAQPFRLKRVSSIFQEHQSMPLSGEAIRTMNYVDDISVTLRRILAVLPSLTEDERQRVSDHIKAAEPSYESVITAVASKK